MRKSLLTLALILGSSAFISAQNAKFSVSKSAEPAQAFQKVNFDKNSVAPLQKTMKNTEGLFKGSNNIVRRAGSSVEALYGFPVGGLYYGLADDSYSFTSIRMVTGAFEDVTFGNYSNDGSNYITDVTWSWPADDNGKPVEPLSQSVNEYGDLTAQGFGTILFPILKTGNSTYGESFMNSEDEAVSAFWESGMEQFGTATFALSPTETEDKPISISNACIQFGFYGGFGGDYRFSSNKNFYTFGNGSDWTNTNKKVVGFAEHFDKPLGFVYAKDVTAWFSVAGVTSGSPLNGKTLTATIYTFGADGKLKPYAEATATDADAQAVGTGGLYLISFKFTEDDPVMGPVEAPIALPDEEFVVMLTGFENLSGTFTALFADANGFDGHAYALLEDSSLATISYTNSPSPRCNLHIGFHAAVPVADLYSPEDGVAVAPVEGGYVVTGTTSEGKDANDIDIYTMTSPDEWLVDYPDWIEGYEYDDTYLDRGLLVFFIKAAPLPAGVEGRTGEVTFSLYGKDVKVTVNQGSAAAGVSSVENNAAKKNSAIYSISGQRVNKDYKGIMIQNGKKFINK